MEIRRMSGRNISDLVDTEGDLGPVIYEVIPPLTIQEVIHEYNKYALTLLEWELSGQLVCLLPWNEADQFEFWSDGTFGFYQKIEQ